MTLDELLTYLSVLSPKDMMKNADYVSGMARKIRLRQGVGSVDDELALCRLLLDMKFMVELIDAAKEEIANVDKLRETYERKLLALTQEIEALRGRNIQSPKTGS